MRHLPVGQHLPEDGILREDLRRLLDVLTGVVVTPQIFRAIDHAAPGVGILRLAIAGLQIIRNRILELAHAMLCLGQRQPALREHAVVAHQLARQVQSRLHVALGKGKLPAI